MRKHLRALRAAWRAYRRALRNPPVTCAEFADRLARTEGVVLYLDGKQVARSASDHWPSR